MIQLLKHVHLLHDCDIVARWEYDVVARGFTCNHELCEHLLVRCEIVHYDIAIELFFESLYDLVWCVVGPVVNIKDIFLLFAG